MSNDVDFFVACLLQDVKDSVLELDGIIHMAVEGILIGCVDFASVNLEEVWDFSPIIDDGVFILKSQSADQYEWVFAVAIIQPFGCRFKDD